MKTKSKTKCSSKTQQLQTGDFFLVWGAGDMARVVGDFQHKIQNENLHDLRLTIIKQ